MRRIGLGILGFVTVVTLLGCTPNDDVVAGLVDGKLTFVFCEGGSADRLTVESNPRDQSPYKPEEVWVVDGDRFFDAGEPVTYGVTPRGMTETQAPSGLILAGSNVAINRLTLAPDGEITGSEGAVFNGDKVDSGSWLTPSESRRSRPCEG